LDARYCFQNGEQKEDFPVAAAAYG